jgi:uncharacterized protein
MRRGRCLGKLIAIDATRCSWPAGVRAGRDVARCDDDAVIPRHEETSVMAVPSKINIVTLGVADLERASAFYAALGWRRSSASNDQIAWFVTAGPVLGLFPFDELARDAALDPERRAGFGGITLAINVRTETEVTPALEAAVAAGGALLKPATRADWGGLSGYFADPDGYPWEVAWNPFFPLDEAGLLEMP